MCMKVKKGEIIMRSQLKHLSKKAQSDVSLKYALQIIQDNESKDLSQIATRYLTYLDRSGR